MNLPFYIGRFNHAKFLRFLDANGVEILTPTNEWEVIRVYFNDAVGVVYQNASGRLNWQGEHLKKAWDAYQSKKPLECWIDKTRSGVKKKSPKFQAIIDRDGYECFYCGIGLTPDTDSVEHMLSKAHGGSNHIKNLVLACKTCNHEAGHLSIAEKVKLRDKLRNPELLKGGSDES